MTRRSTQPSTRTVRYEGGVEVLLVLGENRELVVNTGDVVDLAAEDAQRLLARPDFVESIRADAGASPEPTADSNDPDIPGH